MDEEVMQYNFSDALTKIKQGCCMQRAVWSDKGMFVFLVPGAAFEVDRDPLLSLLGGGTEVAYLPHIDICHSDGSFGVWQPSAVDLFAEDWQVAG